MRLPLLLLCGILIAAGGFVAARATAPALPTASMPVASANSVDQAAFGKTIHDYLVAHPEVLVEAMEALERRQNTERDAAAQKAIGQQRAIASEPIGTSVVCPSSASLTIRRRPTTKPASSRRGSSSSSACTARSHSARGCAWKSRGWIRSISR